MQEAVKGWAHRANIVARLRKTSSWVFYGVVIGSLPIGFTYVQNARMHDGNLSGIRFDDLFGQGDLFLLSTAIAGGAVGELIGASKNWLTTKRLAQTCCILFVAFSSWWFACLQDHTHDSKLRHFDAVGSVVMFVGSVVFGVVCIYLSEEREA